MLQAQDKKRPGSFLAVDYKCILYYMSSCGGPHYPTVGKVTGAYLSLQLGVNFHMQPIFFPFHPDLPQDICSQCQGKQWELYFYSWRQDRSPVFY